MNLDVVLKLVSAAVGVLPTLVEAGISIYDRVQKIQKLAASVPESTQKEMVKATDALPTTAAVVSTLAPDIPSPTVVTPEQAVIKQ